MLLSVLRLIFKTSSVTPDFFYVFQSNLIIFYRQSKFKKNLYVGSFWTRTSLKCMIDDASYILRTLVRNIDFFLKISPLKDDELVMLEM